VNPHVEVSGTGDIPVVCVHGWACHGGHFAEVAERLGSRFRVYRPDLPGHGQTPLGNFEPTFPGYTAVLADFLKSLAPARPMVVGHSMGGVLSLMAAAQVDVRAVINLDGSLPARESTLAAQATVASWLDEPDYLERLRVALAEGFFLPTERGPRCNEIIDGMCRAPREVLRFLPEQIHTIDPSAFLPRVQAPMLYVGAARPRYDEAGALALNAAIRFTQIAGAGHFLPIFAAEKVADLVERVAAAT